jgi:hypothetical protein
MNPFFKTPLIGVLLATTLIGLSVIASPEPSGKEGLKTPTFEFALIGDLQYTAAEEAKFLNLRDAINRANLAFVVHDGDFKSGSSRCTDELFRQRYAEFQMFVHPLIYIFGDNEWTDCHRASAGGFDPVERLETLRGIFTQGDESLGQRTLQFARQSDDPRYRKFRENVRWSYGHVMFIGLNVPGSNNNFGRTPEADAEYFERNAANLVWLRESLALATTQESRGVMIIIQANPGFELPPTHPERTGYNDFLSALEREVLAFGRPVVLVHGDSHYFRIDKPMLGSRDGRRIESFTRVETFGSPDVHWVRATVDFRDPNLFSFTQELVEQNLVVHPLP